MPCFTCFTLKEKNIHEVFLVYLFVGICLPQCSFFLSRFLDYFNGLVVKALNSQSGIPYSKPLGGSKVSSAFHPSDIDQMSTRNFWELSGKE